MSPTSDLTGKYIERVSFIVIYNDIEHHVMHVGETVRINRTVKTPTEVRLCPNTMGQEI